MTATRKTTKILLAAIVAAIFCLLLASKASAANYCSTVSGRLDGTVTFRVDVGGSWFGSEKIVLKQNKGVMDTIGYYDGGIHTNVDRYGIFYLTVYDRTEGKYVYNEREWKDKTFTIFSIKLKNNHSYDFTLRGKPNENILDGYSTLRYKFSGWVKYPTWSVSKTGTNISFCK